MAAINTPFPTIQPAGPTITAQEFTRMQGNIANALKNLSPQTETAAVSPVIASYYASVNQTTDAATPLNFDTKSIDTGGLANPLVTNAGGIWKFTAPITGYYHVSIELDWSSGSAGQVASLYVNDVNTQYISNTWGLGTGEVQFVTGSLVIYLTAGQFIDIRSASGSATFVGSGIPYPTYINIFQVH